MADSVTIFEQYPVASWQAAGLAPLAFPVASINESGGNRIVERERPYRSGAKLDATGTKAKKWSVRVSFDNGITEPGLDTGKLLYPTVLNELLAAFDSQETGDLVLPTRGSLRVKAESYMRDESKDNRDSAEVTFNFVEDNEDHVGGSSFALPSVQASARRLAEKTRFSATQQGAYSTSLADLNEFAAGLETIANAPSSTLADLDSQAGIVISACNRVLKAFAGQLRTSRRRGNDPLNDPDASHTQRSLLELADCAGRSRNDALAGRPKTSPYRVTQGTDLYTVATKLDTDAQRLIQLNPRVDPLFVPVGTILTVEGV